MTPREVDRARRELEERERAGGPLVLVPDRPDVDYVRLVDAYGIIHEFYSWAAYRRYMRRAASMREESHA
jgi:hypothetical protein